MKKAVIRNNKIFVGQENYSVDSIIKNRLKTVFSLSSLIISILIISFSCYTHITGEGDGFFLKELFLLSSFGFSFFSPLTIVGYYLLYYFFKSSFQFKLKLNDGTAADIQLLNPLDRIKFKSRINQDKNIKVLVNHYKYDRQNNSETWRWFKRFIILNLGYYAILMLLYIYTNNHDFFAPDLATDSRLIYSLIGLSPLIVINVLIFFLVKLKAEKRINIVFQLKEAIIFITLIFLISIPFYLPIIF